MFSLNEMIQFYQCEMQYKNFLLGFIMITSSLNSPQIMELQHQNQPLHRQLQQIEEKWQKWIGENQYSEQPWTPEQQML